VGGRGGISAARPEREKISTPRDVSFADPAFFDRIFLKNISTCFDISWEVVNQCVNTKKAVDCV
jgi:hypothetical protein